MISNVNAQHYRPGFFVPAGDRIIEDCARRTLSVDNAFGVRVGKTLLFCGLPLLGHDSCPEVCLGRGHAASELDVDADIAHCHLRACQRAQHHEVIEVAEMPDPEDLAFELHLTAREHVAALAGERRQSGGRLAGIVLDLRGNPGGLLDQAVSLSDLFIHDGPIVSTVGRHPASHQYFAASGHSVAAQIPIVVLINGGSASSSEIVAAALQDSGRAVVIGSSSYGKGTVQTVLRLPNDGELTLTWARLVTPAGYYLQTHGVVPTLCTSDLGDDETSLQRGLQRAGAIGHVSAGGLRSRGGLDERAWSDLRQSCPARQTRPAVDLKLAERVLAKMAEA